MYFFANDSIFFCKFEENSLSFLKEVLVEYGKAFGQLINLSKSWVLLSGNASELKKDWVYSFLDVQIMDNNTKYMGLPTFCGRSKGKALIIFWTE